MHQLFDILQVHWSDHIYQGNKLNLKVANGFFDIAKHTIIDLHSVNSASQNTSGTAATGQTYGTEFETFLSQTKIGTARIRDIDFLQDSGSTTNTSHFHSDYVLYLYDIRTSNNKTGTVGESNSSATFGKKVQFVKIEWDESHELSLSNPSILILLEINFTVYSFWSCWEYKT